ncbi:hypothetical protein [Halomonas shantousis]
MKVQVASVVVGEVRQLGSRSVDAARQLPAGRRKHIGSSAL